MQAYNTSGLRLFFREKLILITFGVSVGLIVIEVGFRLAGFLFLSLQEYNNRKAIYKQGTYRIMCLGESTTVLGGDDSYPSQLEEVLNQRNIGVKFNVINKGVGGIDTNYILAHLEENLNRYKPDMVIAMTGVNDEYIKYYEAIPEAESWLSKNSRTYKFLRLFWMHGVNKITGQKLSIQNNILLHYCFNTIFSRKECYAEQQTTPLLILTEDMYYVNLGQSYAWTAEYSKAEANFKKAIEINPKNYAAYIGLGKVYHKQENDINARELLMKAIEINPNNAEAYYALAWLYMKKGDFKQIEAMGNKCIELNSHRHRAYIYLGWSYLYQGRLLEAENALKKAIELNPGEHILYRALSVISKEMGKNESAKQYLNKANELSLGYGRQTQKNYLKLKDTLDKRRIKLVCVQYPMRSIAPLKQLFNNPEAIIFVDNEKVFREAVAKSSYQEYFVDIFAGDFGHCTLKGNRLLAENIARVILKEYFWK